MARQKTIAVRLDQAEIDALRRLPGTDSERMRALIQNNAIFDSMAEKMAEEFDKKLDTLTKEVTLKIDEAVKHIKAADRANINELIIKLNPVLSQLLGQVQK